jgi:hypothetical protein
MPCPSHLPWLDQFSYNFQNILFAWIKYFFPLALSPNLGLGLPPWNSPFHFVLLILRHSLGLLGRVISSPEGLSTFT